MNKLAGTLAALGLAAASGSAMASSTMVYQNDFNSASTAGGVTAAIGGPQLASGFGVTNYGGVTGNFIYNDSGNNYGGGPAPQMTTFTLSNLPSHTSLDVDFHLMFIDSWDSTNGGAGVSPDYLEVYLDGVLWAQLTAANTSGTINDFAGGTQTFGPGNFVYNGYADRIVDMSTAGGLSFAHTASTFTLGIRAGGSGWQGGADESWGIDNLKITATLRDPTGAIPEPATWAMMILGFGAAGTAMRRRRAMALAR